MRNRRVAILRSPLILGRAIIKFFADNGPFLASGIAFDLLLYCIPFSLLIGSALGYALGGSTQPLEALQAVLQQLLPTTDRIFAENLSVVLANRGLLGLLGFALLFLASSVTFGSIRIALNTVFQVRNPPGFLRGKAKDFIVMLVATGLLILMIAFASLLALAKSFGNQFMILQTLLRPGWVLTSTLLGFLFTYTLFYLLYRFSPAKTLQRPALVVTSLTGAGLFELSKLAFAWYVKLAQHNVALYGTFGGLLFFFFWIYYACVVLILSAEIGWCLQQELRSSNGNR
ncbi:MAG: YihY/virulence factor BrkB family protein [Nitrospiraceae bacterium]|nr:MAG: YihY/virulence factor BrkB family protein [Nitrospiraceae bacterium]